MARQKHCRGNQELLEMLSSVLAMSYQKKMDIYFFPEYLVYIKADDI
jgi:hypothetical protein